jgi:hypothetical protein
MADEAVLNLVLQLKPPTKKRKIPAKKKNPRRKEKFPQKEKSLLFKINYLDKNDKFSV